GQFARGDYAADFLEPFLEVAPPFRTRSSQDELPQAGQCLFNVEVQFRVEVPFVTDFEEPLEDYFRTRPLPVRIEDQFRPVPVVAGELQETVQFRVFHGGQARFEPFQPV